jgi:hypothetical protein
MQKIKQDFLLNHFDTHLSSNMFFSKFNVQRVTPNIHTENRS